MENIIDLENMWTVEYSLTQGCFHVDTLLRTLQSNRRVMQRGWQPEYAVIALCKTREECNEVMDNWCELGYKKKIAPEEMYKLEAAKRISKEEILEWPWYEPFWIVGIGENKELPQMWAYINNTRNLIPIAGFYFGKLEDCDSKWQAFTCKPKEPSDE